ncbi:prephenate dehydrogenase/arogenate dehydrogenase family protein [Rhodococcus sp. NPDC058521]|uniref:prephenate dehydrogenase/arogenate dehydrogenase family protein n=1 Tax=Rhodococcus sp. NPDC058521 TaxID=3346536 RepID=UPI0036697EBE
MTVAPVAERKPTVVVGGAGAVGTMLADLYRCTGANVVVVDRTDPETVGRYVHGDITAPGPALRELLRSAATVLLAVPETVAVAALPRIADLLDADAVLVDTLSVKSRFADAVGASELSCAALGVNPMFAPSLDPKGRPIAAVTYRPGPGVDATVRTLESTGAVVTPLAAGEHDELTALTQALTHASILAFGLALADAGANGSELAALGTPPHLTSLALLARVTGGTPEVYWDVQAGNPAAPDARRRLADALALLDDTVEGGDEETFAALMTRASSALGAHADAFRDLCGQLFADLRRKDET